MRVDETVESRLEAPTRTAAAVREVLDQHYAFSAESRCCESKESDGYMLHLIPLSGVSIGAGALRASRIGMFPVLREIN
jgi:hypothetical protein